MQVPAFSRLLFFKGKKKNCLIHTKCMIVSILHCFWPFGHVSYPLYLTGVGIRLQKIVCFFNLKLGP